MLVDAHLLVVPHGARGPGMRAVIADIRAHRILTLAVSLDPDAYFRTREAAVGEPLVLAALGVHPSCAADWEPRLDEALEQAEHAPRIGLVGLDRRTVTDRATDAAQGRVFEALLAVAARRDVPVHVVADGAESEVAAALERHAVRRAVVHGYRGPVSVFRRLVDLGCWFTVGSDVLVSEAARSVAREIPEDRLLTASAPGRVDQVEDVLREVARLRDLRARDVRSLVWRNMGALFRGKPDLETAVGVARRATQ